MISMGDTGKMYNSGMVVQPAGGGKIFAPLLQPARIFEIHQRFTIYFEYLRFTKVAGGRKCPGFGRG
jgi:hypothetical protein